MSALPPRVQQAADSTGATQGPAGALAGPRRHSAGIGYETNKGKGEY